MPRQLLLSREPVDQSVCEFNLDSRETIFLTYTWERREGPGIRRTGKGPAQMQLIGRRPGVMTSNPFGLRLGTWLIQERMRERETETAIEEFNRVRADGADEDVHWVLEQTIAELETIRSHDKLFNDSYPELEIVGQQGCGDLSMNFWNVAFINNNRLGDSPPTLVCLNDEELEYRIYSCIVKWKTAEGAPSRVTIEEVQFNRRGTVREANEMVWVRFGNYWLPRGDIIEFAVSNQQVIREGEIVPLVTTCHEFGDLRHLLLLPNLNPVSALYSGEPQRPHGGYRPRQYFNEDQTEDIWLGEEAFLEDKSQNLLRAALAGPVFLDFPAGANRQLLQGALQRAGYREATSAIEPLSPGGWRFIHRLPNKWVLEVYFKRNTFGWTMLGLSSDNRRIICLACAGRAGRTGYTIEQAAETLLRAGAHNALLIDEGNDVFQFLQGDDGRLREVISPPRGRLRATLIFARPRLRAPDA